jgi:RimJ/RimL family protein N-acetyltransferase
LAANRLLGQYAGMEPVELRVDDLLLRPWRPEDAPAVLAACQDPDIQRFTSVPVPYRPEHAAGFVGEISPRGWSDGTSANFGVFDVADGTLLGSIGLLRMDLPARHGELGYWMAPAARGRGVATRAGRAVVRFGHEKINLHRVNWYADLPNHASRLVALRIGFRMEGIVRAHLAGRDGGFDDAWAAAVLPGEVTDITPAAYASGSVAARRAGVFGRPQPRLELPGGSALRPLDECDADALVRASADPETARWTTTPTPYGPLDALGFIRDRGRYGWVTGVNAAFAVVGPDDAYAGAVNLRLSADPRDGDLAEIGFGMAPWARGRGLGAEAVRALSRWGFEALGLERVLWRAYVGNEASRRTAEKVGFTMEGIERAGCVRRGTRIDAWTGSLLRGDLIA